MIELLPCPMCGEPDPTLEHNQIGVRARGFVRYACKACGECSFWWPDEGRARDFWNKMAEDVNPVPDKAPPPPRVVAVKTDRLRRTITQVTE